MTPAQFDAFEESLKTANRQLPEGPAKEAAVKRYVDFCAAMRRATGLKDAERIARQFGWTG